MMNNWRNLLLAILLISSGGTFLELLLLEHTEKNTQLIPVLLLALIILATTAVLVSQARWLVNCFRVVLLLSLVSALVGFMAFIVWDLAKKSKAGRFGTMILFLALGLGVLGFVIKALVIGSLEGV